MGDRGASRIRQIPNSPRHLLAVLPVAAVLIAIALAFHNIWSLVAASPVLLLWAIAPLVAIWLDSPPRREEGPLTAEDTHFLQQQALHIWRYFHDFGDETNHWLIPDNVEEQNTLQIRKLSPTNLGMLFNARQAAYEFGFTTLPEFAQATLGTLATYDRLEKQRGHIYNWYNIETLCPIPPHIVSAVDSGNLAASLYTLRTGALDLLKRPILAPETFTGLKQTQQPPVKTTITLTSAETPSSAIRSHLRSIAQQTKPAAAPPPNQNQDSKQWFANEISNRLSALSNFAEHYTPWLLPRFESLFNPPQLDGSEHKAIPTLLDAAEYVTELESKLTGTSRDLPKDSTLATSAAELLALLPATRQRLEQLKSDVTKIAAEAERHADAMEYGFLLVEARQLLSIGYDGITHELYSSCYDLLASEARIASFIAVAKGDIPQQSWFRLDRSHVLVNGRAALLSWTGTMFEYMMPSLWMRTFPDTLIARSLESAVRIQKDHVRNIPWGISESGFSKKILRGDTAIRPGAFQS
ncbi:hypothetical protein [Tunturiibacter gelidiferens]|uniref:hypothetical protein n=1 Tax=Tunturiibacter gelidiferens TaxID=3069689 RepID=UPI003D9B045C